MLISKILFLCMMCIFVESKADLVPSPIEVVLHRLEEIEKRCQALEELCLNLQQALDTERSQKHTKVSPSLYPNHEPLEHKIFTEEHALCHEGVNDESPKKLEDVTRHLKKGEIEKAIALLDYFIQNKQHQFRAQALYYKGLILMHQKKTAEADALFSEAYLHLKAVPLAPACTQIQKERQMLFPVQILLKSAECLRRLGKTSEAYFVCEEIRRGLHKIPKKYHKKILNRIQLIASKPSNSASSTKS